MPDLNAIYSDASKQSDLHRNPIIVIPGILGSQLYDQQSDQVIWGVYDSTFQGPNTPKSMRQVALPMSQGTPLSQLTDNIISTKTLDRLRLKVVGIPVQPRAYASILATLGVGGYKDQDFAASGAIDYGDGHFSCFQFNYDWRRSNAENAAKLDAFIKQKKSFVRKNIKEKFGVDKKDIKFDIIAHSMGGLVARYYLRYGNQPIPKENNNLPTLNWQGAKNVEKVILVGTPNNGSVIAFEQILQGQKFAPDWAKHLPFTNIPEYPSSVIGTYPSIYELLPRYRHKAIVDPAGKKTDIFNIDLWDKHNLGLLSETNKRDLAWQLPQTISSEKRRAIAYDHVKKCLHNANKFHQSLDKKAKTPSHLSITLISGDSIQTKERVMFYPEENRTEDNHYTPGDGTVLRSSVLGDQRAGGDYKPGIDSVIDYKKAIFLPRDHLELTRDVTFSDNVLHILLEE